MLTDLPADPDAAAEAATAITRRYREASGRTGSAFVCTPGSGTQILE